MMRRITFLFSISILLSACGADPSFTLLPAEQQFVQETIIDNRVDILWVVDNSGSMENLQKNIADNFEFFMSDFISKGLNFQMAVTTTEEASRMATVKW